MSELLCDACKGQGWVETLVMYKDEPAETYRYKCPGCRGKGQVQGREFVSPEAFSWCIDNFALGHWQIEGQMLTKAHRTTGEHKPLCGSRVGHHLEHCASAPQGWPMCRKCAAKPTTQVPAVFEWEEAKK